MVGGWFSTSKCSVCTRCDSQGRAVPEAISIPSVSGSVVGGPATAVPHGACIHIASIRRGGGEGVSDMCPRSRQETQGHKAFTKVINKERSFRSRRGGGVITMEGDYKMSGVYPRYPGYQIRIDTPLFVPRGVVPRHIQVPAICHW